MVSDWSRTPGSLTGPNIPERRKRCSIRPNRFSKPSMYLALQIRQLLNSWQWPAIRSYPFGGLRFFSTCVKTQSVL